MLALILPVAMVAPVPPPLEQSTADCERPSYASDQLVCAEEALSALDQALRAALQAAAMPGAPAGIAMEPQTDWFKRSRACAMRAAHRACLEAAYRERIALVNALPALSPSSLSWQHAVCEGHAATFATLGPDVLALRWQGRTILATTATALDRWTPFAWVQRRADSLTLHQKNGPTLDCVERP